MGRHYPKDSVTGKLYNNFWEGPRGHYFSQEPVLAFMDTPCDEAKHYTADVTTQHTQDQHGRLRKRSCKKETVLCLQNALQP